MITGEWILVDGRIQGDRNCKKIEHLLKNELSAVKADDCRWAGLYVDKSRCYWELTYPQSHLHGGGPPQLQRLSIKNPNEWK